jgi:hypothetical protein
VKRGTNWTDEKRIVAMRSVGEEASAGWDAVVESGTGA